jgi:WD40 repeat protein
MNATLSSGSPREPLAKAKSTEPARICGTTRFLTASPPPKERPARGIPFSLVLIATIAAVSFGCGPSRSHASSGSDDVEQAATIFRAANNADGSKLLYGHGRNTVNLWDAAKPTTALIRPLPSDNMLLSFLPKSEQFVVGGEIPGRGGAPPSAVRLLFFGNSDLRVKRTVDLPGDTTRVYGVNESWIVLRRQEWTATNETPPWTVQAWRRSGDHWGHEFDLEKHDNKWRIWVMFVGDHTVVEGISSESPGGGKDKSLFELVVTDLETRKTVRRLAPKRRDFACMAVSDGGRYAAFGDKEKFDVYEVPSLRAVGGGDLHDSVSEYSSICLSVSENGQYVGYANASLAVRDVRTGAIVFSYKGNDDLLRSKSNLADATGDEDIQQYRFNNDYAIRTDMCFKHVAFADSGRKLIAVLGTGELRCWDTRSWKVLVEKDLTFPRVLRKLQETAKPLPTKSG